MERKRRIVVVDYKPEWPALFEQECTRLRNALRAVSCVFDIQHIGSTAVPGLAAKPVIDICIGVISFEEGYECVAPIEALGYCYRGENGIARRHYFFKDDPTCTDPHYKRTHHIHVFEAGTDWTRHIAFRDALRSNPHAVSDYAALKRDLAARFPDDMAAYTDAKAVFINGIVRDYMQRSNSL